MCGLTDAFFKGKKKRCLESVCNVKMSEGRGRRVYIGEDLPSRER
jgi:hypothetical protein